MVIPTYNEAAALPRLLAELVRLPLDLRVWVVDDGSPDGTGAIASAWATQYPSRITVVHRPTKSGIARAYHAGLSAAVTAGCTLVGTMDADGSHRPVDLPRLVAAFHDPSLDMVLGSRWVAGGGTVAWPWVRQGLSRLGSAFARRALRLPVWDVTGGFRLMRSTVWAALAPVAAPAGFGVQIAWTATAVQRGFHVGEVPIQFPQRQVGTSKLSLAIVLEALGWVIRAGTRRIWSEGFLPPAKPRDAAPRRTP